MDLEELNELISDDESSCVESKRSTGQRSEATKTVCGMLNSVGGHVIVGIDDKGVLIGQHISVKTIEDI